MVTVWNERSLSFALPWDPGRLSSTIIPAECPGSRASVAKGMTLARAHRELDLIVYEKERCRAGPGELAEVVRYSGVLEPAAKWRARTNGVEAREASPNHHDSWPGWIDPGRLWGQSDPSGRRDRSEKMEDREQIFSILRRRVVLFNKTIGEVWTDSYRFCSRLLLPRRLLDERLPGSFDLRDDTPEVRRQGNNLDQWRYLSKMGGRGRALLLGRKHAHGRPDKSRRRFQCGKTQKLVTGAQVDMGENNNMTSYNPEYDLTAVGTRWVVTHRIN